MSKVLTDPLYVGLLKMLAEERGIPAEKIRPDSSFFHELGMDGLDASDFLAAFAAKFDVDMAGLDYDRRFGPEAPPPFIGVRERRWFVPVTLADLYASAKAGCWISPAHEAVPNF